MKTVISKIVGLFARYKDKDVVPAAEYNANIKALQTAIEVNAEALKEQQEYSGKLINAAIPDGGIVAEHIADYSITTAKLTPALQEHTHTEELLSDFCKDYVPSYLYKTMDPAFTGPLFNSHVSLLAKELSYKPACSITVAQDYNAGWHVKFEDEDKGNGTEWCTEHFNNTATPETFDVAFTANNEFFYDFKGGWIVTYDLGAAWDIGDLKDFININWNYISVFGSYSNSYIDKAQSTVSKVLIRDTNGAPILKNEEAHNILNYFKINTTTKKYDDRHETSVNCSFVPTTDKTKLTGVRYIDFYISYIYTQGQGARPLKSVSEKATLKMPLSSLTDTIQLSKITQGTVPNSNTLTAAALVSCKGSLEHLTIAAKINAPSVTRLLTEADLTLSVPYIGIAPAPPLSEKDAPKDPSVVHPYNKNISSSINALSINAEFIEDTILEDGTHLVKWRVTPYGIVSGISNKETVVKEMRSIITYNDIFISEAAARILGDMMFDTDTMVITAFTPGIDKVQLTFQSTITDLTINSVCVARYKTNTL